MSDGVAGNEAALINALGTNEVQTAGEMEEQHEMIPLNKTRGTA